jgi:hypothetical protein
VPPGSEVVVIVSGGTATAMLSAFDAVALLLSVTVAVKFAVPAAVGVPEIVPTFRLKPAGREPLLTVHVYPPVPPLAVSACEYAAPTVPPGSDAVVTVSGGGAIAMLSAFDVEVLLLSVTVAVKFAVPAAVGVPLMFPPAPRLSPAGRAPLLTVHVYPPVPPLAASACEYATPTVPPGSEAEVTVSGGGVTAMLSAFDAAVLLLSATVAVKFAVPAAVGVPVMAPFTARFSPAGSEPLLTVHEYPPVPPLAVSACEYAVPIVPFGSDAVVIVSVSGATAMLSAFDAELLPLSTTVTVKFAVPGAVGVPAMLPLAARLSPAGGEPAERIQTYPPVPPLAASACVYGVPTFPPGRDVVVIVSAWITVMLSGFVAVAPSLSVAVTAKFELAAAVGVPEIVPDGLRVSPAGRAPPVTLQPYGALPPVACSV